MDDFTEIKKKNLNSSKEAIQKYWKEHKKKQIYK
jgi:hypothetical protein